MARASVSVGLALILLALCLFGLTMADAKSRLDYPPQLELATGSTIAVPPGLKSELVQLLASEPLDQATLNLLFSVEARGGVDDKRRDALARALGDLGWRSTSAQRNLAVEALSRDDPDEAMLRVDGLLRRDKLREVLLPAMRGLEQDPDATAQMVDRLGRNPDWRADFFAGIDHLADPGARASRSRLFELMIRQGNHLDRTELKPSLDAFVTAGEPDRAFALLRSIGFKPSANALNHDPDFARAAALSAEGIWLPLPSEWVMASRNGISLLATGNGSASLLAIRWNGVGAPWLLRQLVHLGGNRRPVVEILAVSERDWRELRQLGLKWQCRDEQAIQFGDKIVDRLNNRMVFALPQDSPCDYGTLILSGLPQNLDRPLRVELKSIRVLSQAGSPAAVGVATPGVGPRP